MTKKSIILFLFIIMINLLIKNIKWNNKYINNNQQVDSK